MKVMFAGGGTGGHLFPGLAVVEALESLDPDTTCVFVGTEKGIEAREIPKRGYTLHCLDVQFLKGRGLFGGLQGLSHIPKACFAARKIILSEKPNVVVGVGGYASGPLVMTAAMMGIPTCILEQNTVPGITNKILGKLVQKVFINFPEAAAAFATQKVRVVGNPTRKDVLSLSHLPYCPGKPLHILIFGGSQGARVFNQQLPKIISRLSKSQPEFSLEVTHQTGKKSRDEVESLYQHEGFEAHVTPFIDDMSIAYRQADIVVCRAGAGTLTELCISGRPAILVPFPHASDNHQETNARFLEREGAAEVVLESDLDQIEGRLAALLSAPEKLESMSVQARTLSILDAADKVAAELVVMGQRGAA